MTDNEKAAGMLDTSTTASKSQCPASVPAAEKNSNTDAKEFATLQARFARLGRELTRCHRAPDGRITYVVTRWGESRYFSSLGAVQMHLHAVRRATHG